ncbi:Glycerophosphoryl diester phosphodiesterase precursor [Pirellulimonas nuda]|uniref:glycerophosphodiester phosphodiesterase n=1 Tax=Pirellulimonas nuda TaxID=2528009 RepID=A0A518DG62_9BACT|nr:glycerophosphodiester phosphodiesterase family protein [Pirellulimonas nuda]QDU90465.1 Glycerophosphoryl diester phosphodiesterase precursor [Pirellulimonas nuda]
MQQNEITKRFARSALTAATLLSVTPIVMGAELADRPLVLAHRGASGYLPEHTLAGVAMAHALGADYIEQDVVLTRDGQAIVLHDLTLDSTTDVSEVFPSRVNAQGHWPAAEFTLAEVRRLRVNSRRSAAGGPATHPGRFPMAQALPLRVPTLDEEMVLIDGLNRSTGRRVGLIVEIKGPAEHADRGLDVSRETLRVLDKHGYRRPEDAAIVQCFDTQELRRVRGELGCGLRLCQLLGGDQPPDAAALADIASYAQSIGPAYGLVLDETGRTTGLAEGAHRAGLLVFPYTVRRDALPPHSADATALIRRLVDAGADGYFTDFPDDRLARRGTQKNAAQQE